MLKYMLDTNIVIFIIKNKPEHLLPLFNENQARICISSITLMELIYGAEKSAKVAQNLSVIESFCSRLTVLDYNEGAAYHSGQIRAELAKTGQPIGPYDAMIAGHARSLGLTVVTNNVKEFTKVNGLRVIDWSK
ncbi:MULTISPECIES: type II toxin-antitoxin system tRNA(fMet)-specific endonuclease VapC [Gallibacterium]|uniref:Ribonuclease VapC n=1 Tax=Gallibacterium salpingitidis TaxID=505341 RepID=A0AB36E4C5_9PAST|nr:MULTISPECIES: tRNA(fMet)-specific endonuclease VapC [Gallibacterium]MDA3977689.1 tRNA(fMet)-specific endonuclease VapC [Gallibacterium sp. AGMB14963]OBX10086.1 plasmid maintenance protein [Gallibacterium salpingitidis]OBX11544.1 plasmid maintenance protein [Gallibacterium salpingitidis]WKS98648.1 tRNA(fMet)-specific endonuclease VapC [Gallibacterium salpingitidis]